MLLMMLGCSISGPTLRTCTVGSPPLGHHRAFAGAFRAHNVSSGQWRHNAGTCGVGLFDRQCCGRRCWGPVVDGGAAGPGAASCASVPVFAAPGVPAPAVSAVASFGSLLLSAPHWISENSVSVELSLSLPIC